MSEESKNALSANTKLKEELFIQSNGVENLLQRFKAQGDEFLRMKVENEILGIIVLNETQDDEYQELNWLTSALHKSIVVHRLAVKPKHQGKGIAQKLMAFGEEHAWKNDYNSIRLDTFSQNPRNQQFYLKRNYKFIGEVFLKYKKDFSYFCYELMNLLQAINAVQVILLGLSLEYYKNLFVIRKLVPVRLHCLYNTI